MLDLNQILRANEINFAILAFLPALACALILGALIRHPFYNEVCTNERLYHSSCRISPIVSSVCCSSHSRMLNAYLLSVVLLQRGAKGRGRKAQMIRRMLMVEVEKGVMTCQIRDDENRVILNFSLVLFLHEIAKQ